MKQTVQGSHCIFALPLHLSINALLGGGGKLVLLNNVLTAQQKLLTLSNICLFFF